MCQMVAAGLGIAVLPELAVQPHLRSMGLRNIGLRGTWTERTLMLCARNSAAWLAGCKEFEFDLIVTQAMFTQRGCDREHHGFWAADESG